MKLQQKENLLSINPNKEPLTKESLKTFSGFENLSDEELNEKLFSIQTLSALMYEFYRRCSQRRVKKRALK